MQTKRHVGTVGPNRELILADPPTWLKVGSAVWVTLHRKAAPEIRGSGANRYLWGVVYAELAAETGNDPESIHLGLKREAVKKGILEPEYILMGSNLLEGEPTTVQDSEIFWNYVNWVRHEAEHGNLTGQPCHIREPNE